MNSEKLYPSLEKLNTDGEIDKDDLNNMIENKVYKERLSLMEYKKVEISNRVKRQKNNKKGFNDLATGVKIAGLATSFGLAIVTIVFTSGIVAPLFVVPLCSGLTLFSIGASEGLQKLIRRKKQMIKKKLVHLGDIVSKLEIFMEKAKDDKIITTKEIEAYNKLVREDIKNYNKQQSLTKEEKAFLEEASKDLMEMLVKNRNQQGPEFLK